MFKKPEYDNSQTMENILRLRLEEANLLGFETYAHLATSSRMLSTPKMVFSFLTDLAQEIRPKANQEWKELIEFAHDMGHKSMHPYDVSFFSEKLREHRFSYNEDDVRKYFPLVKVFKGLFDLLHHLFQLRFVPLKTSGWAPGVVAYEVYRQNQLKGVLYFDLYARPHKQNGAWMQEIQNRIDIGKETQLPIAYLTCNFPPPKGANSRCLSHEDIQTLLHEMGHGLHQLLTDISIPSVGGMSGMEWDAVELPSQFLESFAWRYEVLELMSSHIETQASLPKELFEKIRAAGHFQSNIKTLRQVALSLTDLWIHTDQIKTVGPYFLEWLQQVWVEANEYNVLPMSGLTRPLHSFLHIFSGGYAAGYYSYIWADLLASDVYAAFPKGPLEKSARIGNLLIDEFLSKGSVRPAITSFIAFRGREPVIEFLLHKWEI
jgi:oligopeptidase A